jgi:hypothetical protein
MDVQEANNVLRYGIAVLRGQNIISKPAGRIQIALVLMKRLSEEGFWWQTKVLQFWIHRAQGGQICAE